MRNGMSNMGKPRDIEYVPVELHRTTEEEFEMWDQEPCLASAD